MALNSYFKLTSSEANETTYIEDMYAESIQINGYELIYIERTSENRDNILGEDVLSSFSSYKPIEMYLSDVTGFERGDLVVKFGHKRRDEVQLEVSYKRLNAEFQTPTKPNEGDVINFPVANN